MELVKKFGGLIAGLIAIVFVMGACNAMIGSDGSDKVEIVKAQEETNQAMIHQAGVNAGVNSIMGGGSK